MCLAIFLLHIFSSFPIIVNLSSQQGFHKLTLKIHAILINEPKLTTYSNFTLARIVSIEKTSNCRILLA